MASCNECICSEVCYYKSFNEVRNLKKRRNDVEKICKSFVHRDILKNAPTVDSVEVVHGRWIISSDGYYPYCAECKNEPKGGEMTPYCPNCGANMDGVENDA